MTGTTQPDPQVEPDDDPRRDALRCIECEFRADDSPGGWYELTEHRNATGHRYEHVRPAPKPLTVADIPAGQGPASLFLMTRYRPGSARSHWQLIYKREDGTLAPQVTPAGPEDAVFAVLQHLAATLPTVPEDAP